MSYIEEGFNIFECHAQLRTTRLNSVIEFGEKREGKREREKTGFATKFPL